MISQPMSKPMTAMVTGGKPRATIGPPIALGPIEHIVHGWWLMAVVVEWMILRERQIAASRTGCRDAGKCVGETRAVFPRTRGSRDGR